MQDPSTLLQLFHYLLYLSLPHLILQRYCSIKHLIKQLMHLFSQEALALFLQFIFHSLPYYIIKQLQ